MHPRPLAASGFTHSTPIPQSWTLCHPTFPTPNKSATFGACGAPRAFLSHFKQTPHCAEFSSSRTQINSFLGSAFGCWLFVPSGLIERLVSSFVAGVTGAGAAMEYYPAPGRNHLFVPGPTNVPETILRAMNRGNEDHRSPAFPKLSKSVIDDVKQIFRTTTATSFIFPTTGTGAWESALTNTLSPGDRIISFELGQFSLLWIDQMQRYNFDVDVIECEWGTGANLELLKEKLQSDRSHSVKAVCVVHNETSTGVTNDIGAVRKVLDETRHPALLLVDGVSSIGAIDFRMDDWKVDVALTGSQKALSLPTGLGIVCASAKALEAAKHSKSTRVFFDWGDYLKFYKAGSYWPYTPSSQMLYGLRASLDMILHEEGLDNVIARHCRLAEATRQAVKAWGLTLCTTNSKWKSDTVTAVVVPSWLDSGEVVKIAYKKYNLSLGVGLNKVAGKIFRIGHLGNINELQLLGALAGVELSLREVGYQVTLGSGVAAAQAHLAKKTPLIPSRL